MEAYFVKVLGKATFPPLKYFPFYMCIMKIMQRYGTQRCGKINTSIVQLVQRIIGSSWCIIYQCFNKCVQTLKIMLKSAKYIYFSVIASLVNIFAMVWNVYAPQNCYVEILTPKVMVLGNGALVKWLGHEGGPLVIGISPLIKETPESKLSLPPCEPDTYQTLDLQAPWS